MKPITTKIHGWLDYIVGMLHLIGPALLGYSYDTVAAIVPLMIGLLIIAYSLLTDYELSLYRRIPMKAHLLLDIIAALLLFCFSRFLVLSAPLRTACLVVSLTEILVVVLTQRTREPLSEKRKREFYSSRR